MAIQGLNTFCLFLQEEDSFFNAIEESRFPRIVGSGEFWCLDLLCVAVEGVEVLTLGAGTSLANAWASSWHAFLFLAFHTQLRPVMFIFFVKHC